ncbi:hypothetical protein MT325_m732L [Paramecium bursaria chlorella virus MT325]|uniref:Uncharacterized protein m732L n=1 Tax=Paramecium bursaria Chlorella virus MT325 TaxID=346932 RepID=A7IVB2_PBCVM|nr:hypothetical protein MT325_m732L [Paramecium bursaria chlorella virus MT325]
MANFSVSLMTEKMSEYFPEPIFLRVNINIFSLTTFYLCYFLTTLVTQIKIINLINVICVDSSTRF